MEIYYITLRSGTLIRQIVAGISFHRVMKLNYTNGNNFLSARLLPQFTTFPFADAKYGRNLNKLIIRTHAYTRRLLEYFVYKAQNVCAGFPAFDRQCRFYWRGNAKSRLEKKREQRSSSRKWDNAVEKLRLIAQTRSIEALPFSRRYERSLYAFCSIDCSLIDWFSHPVRIFIDALLIS